MNNWLIVFTQVGAYQASVARALIKVGANLAFVGGGRKEKIQISIRSDEKFYSKTNFHLGKALAQPLEDYFPCSGGGHPTAAGINGEGSFKKYVKKAKEILHKRLVN
jgi:hypothetical protein